MTPDHTPRDFSWRDVSWLTIVLALVALGTFMVTATPNRYYPVPIMMESVGGFRTTQISGAPTSVEDQTVSSDVGASYPYPYQNPSAPVTDTREFLKVNYGAEMLTRDVTGLTRRVETTVRGYSGRVDSESSSPKYGYVSFVVPMSKYNAFRTELESLVGSRFLTVHVSSENLLPQKQGIETQQEQADAALADYQASRTKLVAAHASAVALLQSKIDVETRELANLRQELSTPELEAQIQSVANNVSTLKSQLASENASYAKKLASADANITYAKDWQKAIANEDQAFLDNVATVNGTVSLRWISLWELFHLYLPGYSIPAIFAVLAFLSYLWDRRRFKNVSA